MLKKTKNGVHKVNGFTLIELLIAIAIVAFLSISVIVALNPAKRIRDAKDDTRRTDIDSILTAIHAYIVDNRGALPTGLTMSFSERQLGTALVGCTNANNGCTAASTACIDLSTPLASYLKTIPVDPDMAATSTGYTVEVDANGLVTVKACEAEGGTNLQVSR